MIPVAVPAPKLTVTGIADQIERAMWAQLQGTAFAQRSVSVVAGGERGADRNAMIAEVQAKLGRDPFYIPRDVLSQELRFIVRGVTSSDPDTRNAALRRAGEVLLRVVRRNVADQTSRSGRQFRELTAKYAKFKQRTYGFVKPILRATGDLLDGLRIRIDP